MRSTINGPFVDGILFGIGMPALSVLIAHAAGELRPWLVQGAVYGLMPMFAVLGLVAYFLTKRLRPHYLQRHQRPLHFTHGLVLGAWIVGVALMWTASAHTDTAPRLMSSLTGGVMLVAFWPWVGSVLAHFEPQSQSGKTEQTQDLTSRPR